MTHLTPEELAAVTDEEIVYAIAAHARRAGLSIAEWIDRELAKDEDEE